MSMGKLSQAIAGSRCAPIYVDGHPRKALTPPFRLCRWVAAAPLPRRPLLLAHSGPLPRGERVGHSPRAAWGSAAAWEHANCTRGSELQNELPHAERTTRERASA